MEGPSPPGRVVDSRAGAGAWLSASREQKLGAAFEQIESWQFIDLIGR
jgi:hypothetical protein